MADMKKALDLAGLTSYDSLIKQWVRQNTANQVSTAVDEAVKISTIKAGNSVLVPENKIITLSEVARTGSYNALTDKPDLNFALEDIEGALVDASTSNHLVTLAINADGTLDQESVETEYQGLEIDAWDNDEETNSFSIFSWPIDFAVGDFNKKKLSVVYDGLTYEGYPLKIEPYQGSEAYVFGYLDEDEIGPEDPEYEAYIASGFADFPFKIEWIATPEETGNTLTLWWAFFPNDAKHTFSFTILNEAKQLNPDYLPKKVSAFTNDAGYITEQAISGKADASALTELAERVVQGNWKETDPENPAYIKNRTHYMDLTTTLLKTDKVQPGDWNTDIFSQDLITYSYPIVLNYYYYIQVDDGEVHKLEPFLVNGGNSSLVCLGNPAMAPVYTARTQDTDLNFIFGGIPSGESSFQGAFGCTEPGEHTVHIECHGEKIIEEEETHAFVLANDSKITAAFENVSIEELLAKESISAVIDGVEYTLHRHQVSISTMSQAFQVFGNGAFFGALAAMDSIPIEYDTSIDSDAPLCFVPAQGFLLVNSSDIATIQLDTSGVMETVPADFQELTASDSRQPSLDPFSFTVDIVQDKYTWWRSVFVLETESAVFDVGQQYQVTLGNETYLLEAKNVADCYPEDSSSFPTFNGSYSQGRLLGDITAFQQLTHPVDFSDPDAGHPLNYEEYPFILLDYDYGSSGTQHFVELHLAPRFKGQITDFKLEKVTNVDLKQLDKQFIPDPSWDEVTEKPEFTDNIEVLKLMWGNKAELPSEMFEWYSEGSKQLCFKSTVNTTAIDYPIILPATFQAEGTESPVAVKSFYGSNGQSLADTKATAIYIPSTYYGGSYTPLPSTIEHLVIASETTPECYNRPSLKSVTLLEGVREISKGFNANNPTGSFTNNQNLYTVTIPNTVTTIGALAFAKSGLISIEIPDSVTGELRYTFWNCPNLTSAVIGNSVETLYETFYNCSELTSVVIGNSVETLTGTFYGCSKLTLVKLSSSITTIDNYAFALTGLTELRLPENLTTISSRVFNSSSELTSLYIPASVTSITNFPIFAQNYKLTDLQVAADNANYSSENGILYNKDQTKLIAYPSASGTVTIKSGVTSVEKYAFYRTNVENLIIPDSVTSLGGYLFEDASRSDDQPTANQTLKAVTLGTGISSIYGSSFNEVGLESLTMRNPEPVTVSSSSVIARSLRGIIAIYVPAESVDTYKAATFWSTYADKIQAIPSNP